MNILKISNQTQLALLFLSAVLLSNVSQECQNTSLKFHPFIIEQVEFYQIYNAHILAFPTILLCVVVRCLHKLLHLPNHHITSTIRTSLP